MADTRTQLEVEEWVRNVWLPNNYKQQFSAKSLHLSSGGVFDFDAVSEDQRIVVNISTSNALMSSGKLGVGKLQKMRADILFLLLVDSDHRIMALTENDMYYLCKKEKENGRVPINIDFIKVDIPEDLVKKLQIAKNIASKEVEPLRRKM